LYEPLFLEHETGPHPENAGRLRAVESLLRERGHWERLPRLEPVSAAWEALTAVHDERYLRLVEQFAREGGGMVTADTVMSRRSFAAARLAAGAAVKAVDAVLDGDVSQAFALVRPPGHHAETARGMGFCLINSVAVAARHAVRVRGIARVLVLDFDVHHGNGTQEIFYDDPSVFYASLHQYPAYPGTGAAGELGAGAGEGATLNIPLPEGVGDGGYLRAFDEVLQPAVQRYRPELILLSAGYDAHWTNTRYLASIRMNVTVTGFAAMTLRIQQWARELCGGRAAFVLEGGYDPEALAYSVLATLDSLEGRAPEDPIGPAERAIEPDVTPILDTVRELHGL
jgi:acetoin utilization deacetylase AcuC-like enzyme